MKPLILTLLLASACFADLDDRTTEKRSFPGGRLVIVDNVFGSIDAQAYNGNTVEVEVRRHIRAESAERLEAAKREVKVDMTQSGDTVKLYVDGPFRHEHQSGHNAYQVTYDFVLRVPAAARVDLYTVNGGSIKAHGVQGGFDVKNVNGAIDLAAMAGSGHAKTVNGQVKVAFAQNPREACQFETVNGTIDLTFQPGLAANARMSTVHGDLLTDFEVTAGPSDPAAAETRNGRRVYTSKGRTNVRIGAGGPELQMRTVNGDVFIRKAGK